LSYHATDGTIHAETSGTRSIDIVDKAMQIKLSFSYFGLGSHYESAMGVKRDKKSSVLSTAETDMASSIGFTLGDPDTGDVFDVDVFVDPNYGTFVFNTVSGQSMCPSEAGTEARELPGIKILNSPLGPTMPDEDAIFELLLENNGQETFNFQAYTQLSENQAGLRLTLNGIPFSELVYSQMVPGSVKAILKVERGPTKFRYNPFTVGFRSLCDAAMNMVDQNLGPEHWADQHVPINVEFLQPCSTVELADALASDRTFAISLENTLDEHRRNQLRIVARNPQINQRSWREDSRLERVVAEYRVRGDFIWSPCLDLDGHIINFIDKENSFGFSTAHWFAGPLPDGEYDLRLRTVCNPSPGEVPPRMDGSTSMSVIGLIDRAAPHQFGPIEPVDGVYFPGDVLAVRFDEKIFCNRPFSFNVELQVDGVERKFDMQEMSIVCEQFTIRFTFEDIVPYEVIMDRAATLIINHVEDLAQNHIAAPIKAQVKFGKFQLEAAAVEIPAFAIEMAYVPDMANPTSAAFRSVASDLAGALSTNLKVDASRFEVTHISQAGESWIEVELLVQPSIPGSASVQSATAVVNDMSNLVNSTEPLTGILSKVRRAPVISKIRATTAVRSSEKLRPQGKLVQNAGDESLFWLEVAVWVEVQILLICGVLAIVCRYWHKVRRPVREVGVHPQNAVLGNGEGEGTPSNV